MKVVKIEMISLRSTEGAACQIAGLVEASHLFFSPSQSTPSQVGFLGSVLCFVAVIGTPSPPRARDAGDHDRRASSSSESLFSKAKSKPAFPEAQRHGETAHNALKIIQGHIDTPLNR